MLVLDPSVIECLSRYDWPGNVRELENYIERAVVLCEGSRITPDLLPPQARGESMPRIIRTRSVDLPSVIDELVKLALHSSSTGETNLYEKVVGSVERELIQQVLAACDQVQVKAAARLGINRNTLHKKLKEMSMDTEIEIEEKEFASSGSAS